MTPAGNPGRWVTNDDYPPAAMFDEREGTTGFRLTIGADGLPTGCEITASSGHADLDAKTCQLVMARARFNPGRNAAGRPVGGTYSNRVRWQIPDGYHEALANAGFHVDQNRQGWPRGPQIDPTMSTIDAVGKYPAAARAARQEGDVFMMLAIDAAGKVTRCDVTETSLSAPLDTAACDLMRSEGRFLPALDSNGKPVRGTLPATFRWVLPRGDDSNASPEPRAEPPLRKFSLGEPGSMSMSVLIDAEGRVADCKYDADGGPPLMENPCDAFRGTRRYIPFTDANGQPVAKRVIMRAGIAVEDAVAAKPAPAK